MTTDPDHDDQQLRAIAHALVADAPDAPDWGSVTARSTAAGRLPRLVLLAVGCTVVAGVAGLLVVRGGNDAPTAGSHPASTAAPPQSAVSASTYVVQSGDIPARVASDHCVTVDELNDANASTPGYDAFLVGLEIVLPAGGCPPSDDSATQPLDTVGTPTTAPGERTYVVVPGDFLAGIAEAHCVPMEDLASYNDWPDGVNHPLFPDETVRLPPGACDPETVAMVESAIPTAFPIVDAPYAASAPDLSWLSDERPGFPAPTQVTQAYLGVRNGSGVERGVVVTVGRNYALRDLVDGDPVEIVAAGQPARLWEEHGGDGNVGDIVVWGSDPYIEVRGVDALRFLAMADDDALQASLTGDGAATLAIGELPGGYEVVYDPRPAWDVRIQLTAQNEAGTIDYSIVVTTLNPLLWNFIGEPLQPMDVGGGVTAWHVQGNLIWEVDDSTFAWVIVSEDNLDSAIWLVTDLAQHLTWVDVDEWADRYGVDVPDWLRSDGPS